MHLLWMSFAGEDGNLGVAIVEVSDADAAAIKPEITARFPRHMPGAELFAAANRKAHLLGINPGGEIQYAECNSDRVPKDCIHRLMRKSELIERWLIEAVSE